MSLCPGRHRGGPRTQLSPPVCGILMNTQEFILSGVFIWLDSWEWVLSRFFQTHLYIFAWGCRYAWEGTTEQWLCCVSPSNARDWHVKFFLSHRHLKRIHCCQAMAGTRTKGWNHNKQEGSWGVCYRGVGVSRCNMQWDRSWARICFKHCTPQGEPGMPLWDK